MHADLFILQRNRLGSLCEERRFAREGVPDRRLQKEMHP